MPGLILEGGTFRPVFSCGVMDALLEHGLMFDYVIGVSAGITNGVSYVSRQKGRNIDILRRYRNDPRYMGYANYLKCGSMFGLDFIYDEIPNRLSPFDWEAYLAYPGRVRVGVTNALTGQPEYLDGRALDEKCTMLRATCAIPFFFPAITVGGTPYYDGGLSDPIPIRKAIADGSEKNLIVLTRTADYRKTLSAGTKWAARGLRHRFPALPEVLLTRHKRYNDTVCFCNQLAKHHPGDAVLLRPAHPVESFESDIAKLDAAYQEGYGMVQARLGDIQALFT
ncbi:patatin family protein [Intestinibacillus massiliensis]|nr:patatin family protein [Intestinibacillus massiliensis]